MTRRGSGLLLGAVLALVVAGVIALLLVHPNGVQSGTRSPYTLSALAQPDAAAAAHPEGEWHIPAGDYASTRYSGLTDITTQNVAQLKPVFTFDTGLRRGHEAAPLVVGSTM